MDKQTTVGVIGALGDLGRQVSVLLKLKGFTVLENDVRLQSSVPLETILADASVIHFCIPAAAVPEIDPTDTLLLLHDSVMASSNEASLSQTNGRAVPVHWLMNDAQSVIIATGYTDTAAAASHFAELDLNVKQLSIEEHDRIVARSQAPMVLLIAELLEDLREWSRQGLLTPSGAELLESLESRAARWTSATKTSILKNQEIDVLLSDLAIRRQAKVLSDESEPAINKL